MVDKTVKTRKEHSCCVCNKTIPVNSIAGFLEFKTGKYSDEDIQIGIQYHRYYACKECEEKSINDLIEIK